MAAHKMTATQVAEHLLREYSSDPVVMEAARRLRGETPVMTEQMALHFHTDDSEVAPAQPFVPADQEQKRDSAMGRAMRHADPQWVAAVCRAIGQLQPGDEFTSAELLQRLPSHAVTHDARAVGPIIMSHAREGVLERVDGVTRTTGSHGRPQQVWRRVARGK